MNREYIVYRDTIVEALIHIDEFKTKMDNFTEKNPDYNYNIELNESGQVWEVKVKVNKHEQANTKTT